MPSSKRDKRSDYAKGVSQSLLETSLIQAENPVKLERL